MPKKRRSTGPKPGRGKPPAPTFADDKCPVCIYGEPTDHTCGDLQRRQYELLMRGAR